MPTLDLGGATGTLVVVGNASAVAARPRGTLTHGPGKVNFSSSAVTTISWLCPATVTAGDVWVLSAAFRGGGGTVTVTNIPTTLNFVRRIDTSDVTIVTFWYLAIGLEVPSATLGSVTISVASEYVATTDPWTGCDNANPIGNIVSGTGTTMVATTTLPPVPLGSSLYAFGGAQGVSDVFWPVVGSVAGSFYINPGVSANTGSNTVTDITAGSNYQDAPPQLPSQTYSHAEGGLTEALIALIMQPPPPYFVAEIPANPTTGTNAGQLCGLFRATRFASPPLPNSPMPGGAIRNVVDGVLNSTATVTSATLAFVSTDVGSPVVGLGIPLGTVIQSITSGTSAVMSNSATQTSTNVSIQLGGPDYGPASTTPLTGNTLGSLLTITGIRTFELFYVNYYDPADTTNSGSYNLYWLL